MINIFCFFKGLMLQEVIDEIDVMFMERYKIWYKVFVELLIWGYKIDFEVLCYLDGCCNVVLGSFVWR